MDILDLFCLMTLSITLILTRSYLFEKPREVVSRIKFLAYFPYCPMCVGFWVGLVVSLTPPFNRLFICCVFGAFLSSLISYVVITIMDKIEGLGE